MKGSPKLSKAREAREGAAWLQSSIQISSRSRAGSMGSIAEMEALLTVMEEQSTELRRSKELDVSLEDDYGDDGFEDFIEDDDDVENDEAYGTRNAVDVSKTPSCLL